MDASCLAARIDAIYRSESRRVFTSLLRLLRDFDGAEEALHDAFATAALQWPRDGVPANPRAWLVSVGRNKAIDHVRLRVRHGTVLKQIARDIGGAIAEPSDPADPDTIADDSLRLVFICCHPALPMDAQVALTLREVCGLSTEEIAHAFLVPATTVAQRIVRAKAKIRDARIPFEVPAEAELPDRLDAALAVIYLVFNEGYAASGGCTVTRVDLTAEAIRLARLLAQLLPDPEISGLLGLMLLHDSRRKARVSPDGDLVLIADQDRSQWDSAQIEEGRALACHALSGPTVGVYALQAGIAAVHAAAATSASTDWAKIVALYDLLSKADPSPVVALNRAVALAMRDGPTTGLTLIDRILAEGKLSGYHFAHAARGDLLSRLGRTAEAREAYAQAFALAGQAPERRFLAKRLRALGAAI